MRSLALASSLFSLMLLAATASADPFSHSSTDTPLSLPDLSTTVSTLVVGSGGTINDINVTVSINHTFDGDLRIFLDHVETATTVQLFANYGGAGANIFATFDDEAGLHISSGFPNYGGGAYRPTQPLSAFDGQSVAGTWKLRIIDDNQFDSGRLNSWSIQGDASAVPEPTGLGLLAAGAVAVFVRRRRRRA